MRATGHAKSNAPPDAGAFSTSIVSIFHKLRRWIRTTDVLINRHGPRLSKTINLERHVATLLPGERLFRRLDRRLDRWQVGDAHRARLTALGLPHHRVHDSRHFYAIRAVRTGTPYEFSARQLAHADIAMVAKVYTPSPRAPTSAIDESESRPSNARNRAR